MNKITILGSGTSTGVPILGCNCQVCQSNDPRNNRLRTSILLETKAGKKILVDASPDLRTQLLRTRTQELDAVIITHDHADHTHGIDDLRPYTFKRRNALPVYADAPTGTGLREKFPYIFQREKVYAEKPVLGGGIPLLDLHLLSSGNQSVEGETFEIHSLPHGHGETLSFRHQKFGYIIDCREIPESLVESYRQAKLELLIIDCLRYEPHQTHLHLDLTLRYIQEIAPVTAILTHMGHEMDYLDLTNQLRRRGIKNVFPAIDGKSFYYSNS
jgi:phosphoribosyl 1,2-cyclic phosphate phosphodiesterase